MGRQPAHRARRGAGALHRPLPDARRAARRTRPTRPGSGTPSRRAPASSLGGDGFADVWKKGHFAWEYKGKRKDLAAAYQQLLDYREALENPPLLVVCDLDRFEVRTNFTNTPTQPVRASPSTTSLADPAEPLRVLRRASCATPRCCAPRESAEELTTKAAAKVARLALALAHRGRDPERVARFLDKLLFCLYAEDARVLPKGLLSRLAEATARQPADFATRSTQGVDGAVRPTE